MAKKNRARNHADAIAAGAIKAALEQVLPPPPAYVVDIENVAQVPDAVRDQQFGLYTQSLFDEEDALKADNERLQAEADAAKAEQERYQHAYTKRGAQTDAERGAVLSGEVTTDRIVKVALALAAAFFLAQVG